MGEDRKSDGVFQWAEHASQAMSEKIPPTQIET